MFFSEKTPDTVLAFVELLENTGILERNLRAVINSWGRLPIPFICVWIMVFIGMRRIS
jgi:hypothetical protein